MVRARAGRRVCGAAMRLGGSSPACGKHDTHSAAGDVTIHQHAEPTERANHALEQLLLDVAALLAARVVEVVCVHDAHHVAELVRPPAAVVVPVELRARGEESLEGNVC